MTHVNDNLLPDVQTRLENLDRETAIGWGGRWDDGTAVVSERAEKYNQHTEVRSVEDAMAAFQKYTEYWANVTEYHEPEHDTAVILPCGSNKPIGTSGSHRKKLAALEQAGWTDEMDILIMSEPCTIIPHDDRLAMPAVNYDFPPEYTEKETAPSVFELFVKRLAIFFEHQDYDTVYPYLVKRHQRKFDAAMEKVDLDVTEVPGASYNPETGAYSGDMFQTTENLVRKLKAVRGESIEHTEAVNFYAERDEYGVGA